MPIRAAVNHERERLMTEYCRLALEYMELGGQPRYRVSALPQVLIIDLHNEVVKLRALTRGSPPKKDSVL